MTSCTQCKLQYEHLPEDLDFYKEYDFPAPDLCPNCRHQNRIAFRNERVLYNRDCGLCGKSIIAIFSPDKPIPVFCPDCWWGDKWNALNYGVDFDFTRSFFDQFFELRDKVPRQSLNNSKSVNSDYCNQCIGNKDCYLIFASDENQNSMYSYWINRCTDIYNSSWLSDCTLCFDVIDSEKSYRCIYSQDLNNCSDCYFSYDLIGCKNCFACSGLRNKKYYIKNQLHTKEEYFEKINSLNLGSYNLYSEVKKLFPQFRLKSPHKYVNMINSENCTGDYIIGCKDCHYCFDAFESEKCRYSYNLVHKQYNIVDTSFVTESRNFYQVMSTTGENTFFATLTWFSSDVWYSDLSQNCKNIFGCVGLTHKTNCIFNKEYSESEYKNLKEKIINHMKSTGEWGRFFPVSKSPYAYNETVAQDFFPLNKEEVLSRGWQWKDVEKRNIQETFYHIPDNIQDISEDICEVALTCIDCEKKYKVLSGELKKYKQINIPIPRTCNDCRFKERLSLRNPHKLYDRKCDKCQSNIKTTYAPDRPEKIYCEKCYLKEVY